MDNHPIRYRALDRLTLDAGNVDRTVGFPGVVIANWMQAHLFHKFYRPVGYSLMFLINWLFYCSVLVGIASLKRRFR